VTDSDWLTTTQAAALAHTWRCIASGGRASVVGKPTICNWRDRGHLKPAGLDPSGRPLYRPEDLARAELATRERALRKVGIGSAH
jgi:hypothetical protein